MNNARSSRRFRSDNRAVSAVIGFILVFAILMLTLAVYQAQVVPQQNAQTEFQQFEDTRDELIELRNAISTTGQTDVSQYPSVRLGTTYQTRLLTINPPPPAGTLQTSAEYNITIENAAGERENVSTRFLDYQPGYNELRVGSTRYEHSVLYLDERDRRNNVSIIEEQNIVTDETVRITALQDSFQRTGTERVTLNVFPRTVNTDAFPDPDGDAYTVRIPTQLTEDEYWDEALEDTNGIYQGVDERDDQPNRLILEVDADDLELTAVEFS